MNNNNNKPSNAIQYAFKPLLRGCRINLLATALM